MDWGHLGSLTEEGEAHARCGFTMTLGSSRRMMAEAATNQKLGTLLRMQEAAFDELGSVPGRDFYKSNLRRSWTKSPARNAVHVT